MSFTRSCLLFALLPAAFAITYGVLSQRLPDLWRKLPRERNIGIAIGAVCLIWSAYYGIQLLEGGLSRFHNAVRLLVPVTAVLSYFYLNYVFTRAMGGLLMLTSTYLLHEAFAVHLPLRPVFSLACYVIAVAGMFALATPWHFRDLLKKATESPAWRRALCIGHGVLALLLAVFAFLG